MHQQEDNVNQKKRLCHSTVYAFQLNNTAFFSI